METLELTVEERSRTGKNLARAMRKSGMVPGIMYGASIDNVSVILSEREYQNVIKDTNPSQVFRLKSENPALNESLVLVKSIQIEPIKEKVLHVDMIKLNEGEAVSVTVPVKIVGECPGVKAGLAVLSQMIHEVEVLCIPSKIPSELTADVSTLIEGETLHARDIALPEGVQLKTDGGVGIVAAISKSRRLAANTESVEAEGEAGAEAASAEGGEEKKEE